MSALLFLYKAVLEEPLPWLHDLVRAQRPQRLPVVLTVDEVRRVIDAVEEPSRLIGNGSFPHRRGGRTRRPRAGITTTK